MVYLYTCFLFFISTFLVHGQSTTFLDNKWSHYEKEKIKSFHSDIIIYENGNIRVAETISIYSNGDAVKRGIVRSVPYYYRDNSGKRKVQKLKQLYIERDGKDEKWTETLVGIGESLNRELYIGDENVILTPGLYTYEIVYELENIIDSYDGFDELYWNVTGNDWAFEIDSASATITLLFQSEFINTSCYTGVFGSTEQRCEATVECNRVIFNTIYSLDKNEGFTIAASFPSGIIKRPPPKTGFMLFWTTYTQQILAVLGIAILSFYYIFSWKKVGKRIGGIIIPTFKPPRNLSPSMVQYLYKGKVDDGIITTAIVSMAVKGSLKIEYIKDQYILTGILNNRDKLAREELIIYDIMFKDMSKIELSGRYIPNLGDATKALKLSLERQWSINNLVRSNSWWQFFGAVLSFITLVLYFISTSFDYDVMSYASLMLFCIGTVLILVLLTIKSNLRSFFLISGSGCLILSQLFVDVVQYKNVTTLILVLLILLGYIFYGYLIKGRTGEAAKVEAELKGFRLYLKTAEEHRLNMLIHPEHTLELFEKLLPHAIALGVENKWSLKFKDGLEAVNYQTEWYQSDRSYNDFGSTFTTSLSSSVNRDRTPISRSYGSSNRGSGTRNNGSSGGGRGGGGGRGW